MPRQTGKAGKLQEKIVFVDRDGVINQDRIGGYITRWQDFHFIRGALSGLRFLVNHGFGIVIISNQAGVGDRVYSKRALADITQKMKRAMKRRGIPVRAIYYCLHGKKAGCACRKPKPGLFKLAAQAIRFNRAATFFIGDKKSDMLAGKRFGLRTAFVLTGHGRYERKLLGKSGKPDLVDRNLIGAAKRIVRLDSRAR